MNINASAVANVLGNNVDETFIELSSNGEHGVSEALIAMALDVPDVDAPTTVREIVERVQARVLAYNQRTEPYTWVNA